MGAGLSLTCPSECIVRLPGKRSGMYEPLVLILIGFGTHRVIHRARYPIMPPLDCTMAPPPDNLGQVRPCTGCKKKQSANKRSPCTLCQEPLACRSCSQAGTPCGVCRTNPGWHLEFKAKTVTDTPSVPGTASFFMLCNENTHLYLTLVDMPRAVTEVPCMGEAAPSPEHCPLGHFCHGNTIISTGSDTLVATVHVRPGVGITLRNEQFAGFVVQSPPDPQLSATRGRVLWCTLVLPQMPLLDYLMARHYGWITPREKQSSTVSKVATPKKGSPAHSGSHDSDTEDAVDWRCACQQVHYLENSHAAHDARLLISFAICVLRQPPKTGITTALCPATICHDSPPTAPFRLQTVSCTLSSCPVPRQPRCLVPYPRSVCYDSCLSQSLSRPHILTCSFTSGLSGCSSGHECDSPCHPQSSAFRSVRQQQG